MFPKNGIIVLKKVHNILICDNVSFDKITTVDKREYSVPKNSTNSNNKNDTRSDTNTNKNIITSTTFVLYCVLPVCYATCSSINCVYVGVVLFCGVSAFVIVYSFHVNKINSSLQFFFIAVPLFCLRVFF